MPSLRSVEDRVASFPEYQKAFHETFGTKTSITIDNIAAAIAAYERTLITPDSAYDRFVKGDSRALTPSQLKGMALFETVGCVRCHSGPNFSGASIFDGKAPLRIFPTIKTPYTEKYNLNEDRGGSSSGGLSRAWRIPSLRNVALTGPYLHDGSISSLEETVRVMAATQLGRSLKETSSPDSTLLWSESDRTLTSFERIPVSEVEIKNIAAFLRSLSSEKLLKQTKSED